VSERAQRESNERRKVFGAPLLYFLLAKLRKEREERREEKREEKGEMKW
jgi:hypothetical protein